MSTELEQLLTICKERNVFILRFTLDRLSAVVESPKGDVTCLRYIENQWI